MDNELISTSANVIRGSTHAQTLRRIGGLSKQPFSTVTFRLNFFANVVSMGFP